MAEIIDWDYAVHLAEKHLNHAKAAGTVYYIEDVVELQEAAKVRDDLTWGFVLDNHLEDLGVESDARVTCWTHRCWATEAHIATH